MREVEVRFDNDVPQDLRDIILPIVRDNDWLCPSWVEFIYFKFEDDKNSSLSSNTVEEYRKVIIAVRGGWIKGTPEQRASDIRHEIVHAILDPLYQAGYKVIGAALCSDADKKLREWAEEELRLGVEKATVDLEFALKRLGARNDPR